MVLGPGNVWTQFVPLRLLQASGADQEQMTTRGQCLTQKQVYEGVRKGSWQEEMPDSQGRISKLEWLYCCVSLITYNSLVPFGRCWLLPMKPEWVRIGYLITFVFGWNEKQVSVQIILPHIHTALYFKKQNKNTIRSSKRPFCELSEVLTLLFWMRCLISSWKVHWR